MGTVPGLIGILQATEVLKILTGGETMHDRLLMYDSLRCSFLNVKKPPPKIDCIVCSNVATIKSMEDSRIASKGLRGPSYQRHNVSKKCTVNSKLHDENLMISGSGTLSEHEISCKDYCQIRKKGIPHILLDVRSKRQYEMGTLQGSISIPLANLRDELQTVANLSDHGKKSVFCICRRGITSIEAASILLEIPDVIKGNDHSTDEGDGKHNQKSSYYRSVYSVKGGFDAWAVDVDASFQSF